LESGSEFVVLYVRSDEITIAFNPGFASSYMGDRDGSSFPRTFPSEVFFIRHDNIGGRGRVREDDLFENYGIRIISFEPSPPIQNTFR
jgi:hypothetical protein